MADLESHMEQEHPEISAETRRALLKKLGIGVGAAWIAPTIISSAASAQGSPDPDNVRLCPLCAVHNMLVNGLAGPCDPDAESGTTTGWLFGAAIPPGLLPGLVGGDLTNVGYADVNTPLPPYPPNPTGGSQLFKLGGAVDQAGAPDVGLGAAAGAAEVDPGCAKFRWTMSSQAAAYPAVGPGLGPTPPPLPPGTLPSQAAFLVFLDGSFNPVAFDLVSITTTTMDPYSLSVVQPPTAALVAWGFWAFNAPNPSPPPGLITFSTLFDNVRVAINC